MVQLDDDNEIQPGKARSKDILEAAAELLKVEKEEEMLKKLQWIESLTMV